MTCGAEDAYRRQINDPAIGVEAFARGPPIKDLLSDVNPTLCCPCTDYLALGINVR
jgi:hypothetical protein